MPVALPVLPMPATATRVQQQTHCSLCLQMHPACCHHSCHRSGRHRIHQSTAAVVCISDPLRLVARAASVQCVETHMWARRLEDVTVVAVCGQAMCARRAWRTAYTDWPPRDSPIHSERWKFLVHPRLLLSCVCVRGRPAGIQSDNFRHF